MSKGEVVYMRAVGRCHTRSTSKLSMGAQGRGDNVKCRANPTCICTINHKVVFPHLDLHTNLPSGFSHGNAHLRAWGVVQGEKLNHDRVLGAKGYRFGSLFKYRASHSARSDPSYRTGSRCPRNRYLERGAEGVRIPPRTMHPSQENDSKGPWEDAGPPPYDASRDDSEGAPLLGAEEVGVYSLFRRRACDVHPSFCHRRCSCRDQVLSPLPVFDDFQDSPHMWQVRRGRRPRKASTAVGQQERSFHGNIVT